MGVNGRFNGKNFEPSRRITIFTQYNASYSNFLFDAARVDIYEDDAFSGESSHAQTDRYATNENTKHYPIFLNRHHFGGTFPFNGLFTRFAKTAQTDMHIDPSKQLVMAQGDGSTGRRTVFGLSPA